LEAPYVTKSFFFIRYQKCGLYDLYEGIQSSLEFGHSHGNSLKCETTFLWDLWRNFQIEAHSSKTHDGAF